MYSLLSSSDTEVSVANKFFTHTYTEPCSLDITVLFGAGANIESLVSNAQNILRSLDWTLSDIVCNSKITLATKQSLFSSTVIYKYMYVHLWYSNLCHCVVTVFTAD